MSLIHANHKDFYMRYTSRTNHLTFNYTTSILVPAKFPFHNISKPRTRAPISNKRCLNPWEQRLKASYFENHMMFATQPLEMHREIASTSQILTWKLNATGNRWIWGIILMKMSIKNLATQLLIKMIITIMCQSNQQIKIYIRGYMCWFVNMCMIWQLWSTSQPKYQFIMPLPDLWHTLQVNPTILT